MPIDFRRALQERVLKGRKSTQRDRSGRWNKNYSPFRGRTDRVRIARYLDPFPVARRHFNPAATRQGSRLSFYLPCSCTPDENGTYCNERRTPCTHCLACYQWQRDPEGMGGPYDVALITILDLESYHTFEMQNRRTRETFEVKERCTGKESCRGCREKAPVGFGGKRVWAAGPGIMDKIALYTAQLEATCARCGNRTYIYSLGCSLCGDEVVPQDAVRLMSEQEVSDARNGLATCPGCGERSVPQTEFRCKGTCEKPVPGQPYLIDTHITKKADVDENGKEIQGTGEINLIPAGKWSSVAKVYPGLDVEPIPNEELLKEFQPLPMAEQAKRLGLRIPPALRSEATEGYGDDVHIGD